MNGDEEPSVTEGGMHEARMVRDYACIPSSAPQMADPQLASALRDGSRWFLNDFWRAFFFPPGRRILCAGPERRENGMWFQQIKRDLGKRGCLQ